VGFKCPVCFEDFGRDKIKWQLHIKQCFGGLAEDMVNVVKKITPKKLEEGK